MVLFEKVVSTSVWTRLRSGNLNLRKVVKNIEKKEMERNLVGSLVGISDSGCKSWPWSPRFYGSG